MAENKDEKTKKQELDAETTFADMNVEGFKWYDPHKKTGKTMKGVKLSRKEKWAIFKAALSTLWPVLAFVVFLFSVLYVVCFLWLGL